MAEPSVPAAPSSAPLREAISWTLLGLGLALAVSIASVNIAAAVLTVLLLLADRLGERLPWNAALNGFTYALVGYFAVAVLTSACGVDPGVSFRMLNKDFHKLWMAWLLLTALRYAPAPKAPLLYGAGMCALSVYGIWQTLHSPDYWIRAHGFVHPVTFGQQLAFALLGAVCLLAKSADARELGADRRVLAAGTALLGVAFFFNDTRGAMLGGIAGLAAVASLDAQARKWAWRAGAAVVLIVLLWEMWLPSGRGLVFNLVHRGFKPSNNGQLERLVFWDVGWRMFKDHPWLGVGPGNYRTVFTRYFTGTIEGQTVWGSAHNLYLHQAAERGLAGLAALLAVLAAMLRGAWVRARERADALNLWALACTAGFVVMNITEVSFQNEQVMSLLIFIWALAEARHQRFAD